MIEFILLYFVLCLSSVGLGRLYMYLIGPGELFEFMQPILVELKNENTFIYKSLGGCEVCTRQRFTDFSYLILLSITPSNIWHLHIVWTVIIYIILYCFYGGLAFYFEALISQPPPAPPVIKSQKLEI